MQDKTVLITGGTGTFGKAFVKRMLDLQPKQIRIFSRDEFKQAKMMEELGTDLIHDPVLRFRCGDVRDADVLLKVTEGVDIVVHAAALKRIERCEYDPQEAVKTNIQGSINLINACLANNVKQAIALSTDKAVDPISLYGATKLVMERLWIQANGYRGAKDTKFSLVRYGNVFGARGNVVEVFREQAQKGELTVFSQDLTRFFITIEHAVDLVFLALEEQQGGEIFIPKLKAFNIYRLAELMAGKAAIKVTHDRTTEKVHEVLFTPEETGRMTSYKTHTVLHPKYPSWPYQIIPGDAEAKPLDSGSVEQYTDAEIKGMLGNV